MPDESENIVQFTPRSKEVDDGTLDYYLAINPKPPRRECRHVSFWVDDRNHEVTCRDCGAIVQPFDAILAFAKASHGFAERLRQAREETAALKAWKPWLKAVRKLEEIWRGSMLPCCPHCHRGLEAEALASSGRVNRSLATRLREVEVGKANGELATPAAEVDGEPPDA